jgi:hypothetical protein
VTIDKSQKPGHFCKIKKKIPSDRILKPEQEYMSGKARTCGNPPIAGSADARGPSFQRTPKRMVLFHIFTILFIYPEEYA